MLKKSHLNVLSTIAKFHKPGINTTMVTHYFLLKYVTKKGIKLFGERGVRSVWKDLEQLHDRKMIQPRLPIDLTAEHKIRSLSYIIFLEDKIDG